jgi:hypothetical protein
MQRSIEQLPALNGHLSLSSNSGRCGGLVEFVGYEDKSVSFVLKTKCKLLAYEDRLCFNCDVAHSLKWI